MLKSNRTNPTKHSLNQQGVVSILVSVIIMIILTLTAVSFAQLMRREQRQSLDRQLSAQAYYAAESAINDTIKSFAERAIVGSYDECQAPPGQPLSGFVISDTLGVSYSCVTVETNLESLEFDNIQMDATEQTQLNPADEDGNSVNLGDIVIDWQSNNYTDFAPNYNDNSVPELPALSAWEHNRPGMLRVEIVPIFNGGTAQITRDEMMDPNNEISGRKVFFLYPAVSGPGNINWNLGAEVHGKVFSGNCTTSPPLSPPSPPPSQNMHCRVRITDLPTAGGGDYYSYIVRAKALYRPVSMSLGGVRVDGQQSYFKNAQIDIDATGKANDVLRRIRARVSVDASAGTAQFPLQSYEGICKRLGIVNANAVSYPCFQTPTP